MQRYKLQRMQITACWITRGSTKTQAEKFKTDEKRPLEREEGIVQERWVESIRQILILTRLQRLIYIQTSLYSCQLPSAKLQMRTICSALWESSFRYFLHNKYILCIIFIWLRSYIMYQEKKAFSRRSLVYFLLYSSMSLLVSLTNII